MTNAEATEVQRVGPGTPFNKLHAKYLKGLAGMTGMSEVQMSTLKNLRFYYTSA